MSTLFDNAPDEPISLSLERYAVAFNGHDGISDADPEWELDEDTICETPEAVRELMHDWADTGSWKIVKLHIEAVEVPVLTHLRGMK